MRGMNPAGIKKSFNVTIWHKDIPRLDGEISKFIQDYLVQKLNELNRDGHIGYFTIEQLEEDYGRKE